MKIIHLAIKHGWPIIIQQLQKNVVGESISDFVGRLESVLIENKKLEEEKAKLKAEAELRKRVAEEERKRRLAQWLQEEEQKLAEEEEKKRVAKE